MTWVPLCTVDGSIGRGGGFVSGSVPGSAGEELAGMSSFELKFGFPFGVSDLVSFDFVAG